jgi:hypothetical protein
MFFQMKRPDSRFLFEGNFGIMTELKSKKVFYKALNGKSQLKNKRR